MQSYNKQTVAAACAAQVDSDSAPFSDAVVRAQAAMGISMQAYAAHAVRVGHPLEHLDAFVYFSDAPVSSLAVRTAPPPRALLRAAAACTRAATTLESADLPGTRLRDARVRAEGFSGQRGAGRPRGARLSRR